MLWRPFTTAEWLHTPETVRFFIETLEKSISQLSGSVTDLTGSITKLKGRTENLEQQVSRNSQDSNQPPSADGPFKSRNAKLKRPHRTIGDLHCRTKSKGETTHIFEGVEKEADIVVFTGDLTNVGLVEEKELKI